MTKSDGSQPEASAVISVRSRVVMIVAAVIWLIGMLLTRDGRGCSLLASAECRARVYNWFGDLFWFNWGDNWEVLVAATVAIVAAVVGGRYVMRQIAAQHLSEQASLRRSHRAARAVLSHALAEISQYARDNVGCLKPLHGRPSLSLTLNVGTPGIVWPPFPSSALGLLKEMATYDDEEAGDRCILLANELQVFSSRLRSFQSAIVRDNHISDAEIGDLILGAAEIEAVCASMFGFARQDENPDLLVIDHDLVCSALRNCKIHDPPFASIYTTAKRRFIDNPLGIDADP